MVARAHCVAAPPAPSLLRPPDAVGLGTRAFAREFVLSPRKRTHPLVCPFSWRRKRDSPYGTVATSIQFRRTHDGSFHCVAATQNCSLPRPPDAVAIFPSLAGTGARVRIFTLPIPKEKQHTIKCAVLAEKERFELSRRLPDLRP